MFGLRIGKLGLAVAAVAAAGPPVDPEMVPDPGFDNPADWSLGSPAGSEIADSQITSTTGDPGTPAVCQLLTPTQIGSQYRIRAQVASNNDSIFRMRFGNDAGAQLVVNARDLGQLVDVTVTADGAYTELRIAFHDVAIVLDSVSVQPA